MISENRVIAIFLIAILLAGIIGYEACDNITYGRGLADGLRVQTVQTAMASNDIPYIIGLARDIGANRSYSNKNDNLSELREENDFLYGINRMLENACYENYVKGCQAE